jgi:hypothetical protein
VIFMAAGVIVGMVLLRRASFRVVDDGSAIPPTAAGRDAAGVVLRAFVDPLEAFAAWAAVASLLVIAVAAITSGHPGAVRLRREVASIARSGWQRLPQSEDHLATPWVQQHLDGLRVAGVAFTVLLLWLVDLSWGGLLLLLASVVGYEVALQRLAPPGEEHPVDRTAEPRPST